MPGLSQRGRQGGRVCLGLEHFRAQGPWQGIWEFLLHFGGRHWRQCKYGGDVIVSVVAIFSKHPSG